MAYHTHNHSQSTTPKPSPPAIVPSCALRMYPLRRLKGRGAQKRVIPLAVLSVNSGVSSKSGLPHGVSRLKRCTGVRCMWLYVYHVWEKWWKMMKNAEDKSSSAPSSRFHHYFHHQQPCTLRWLHQSTEDMAMYRMEMKNFHALNFHIHTIFRALENATPRRQAWLSLFLSQRHSSGSLKFSISCTKQCGYVWKWGVPPKK